MIQSYLPIFKLCQDHNLSERDLATRSGISRTTIRNLNQAARENCNLYSFNEIAKFFNRDTTILFSCKDTLTEYSTVATSIYVQADGFESWKVHFFNLVDEFRRTLDPQLILLAPLRKLDIRLQALLAAIVTDLTEQVGMETPRWASKRIFLTQPWFPSNSESLKATAMLESPLAYRNNNIFVQSNFLKRA